MKTLITVGLALVLVSGCNYSYNMRRSSARSSGDLGTTVVVDRLKPESGQDLEEIEKVIDELIAFLDSGQVGTHTMEYLIQSVDKIIPDRYHDLSHALVGSISFLNLTPKSIIGEDAVQIMKDFLKGSRLALQEYTFGR